MSTTEELEARRRSILSGRGTPPRLGPGERRCTTCRDIKPLDAFSQHGDGRPGAVCKSCRATEARERRARAKARKAG